MHSMYAADHIAHASCLRNMSVLTYFAHVPYVKQSSIQCGIIEIYTQQSKIATSDALHHLLDSAEIEADSYVLTLAS